MLKILVWAGPVVYIYMEQSLAKTYVDRSYGWFAVLTSVVSLVLSGCDFLGGEQPVAHSHGSVTVNDKPLPGDVTGRVFFTPMQSAAETTAPPATAEIVDSAYASRHVPVSEMRVTVEIKRPRDARIPRGTSEPLEELKDPVPERRFATAS